MKNLNSVIAKNLKRIRDERKLSLEKASEITGVSKSMLGQIERGESSPTVTTIWKIANGLKVSFTSLVNSPDSDTVIVKHSAIEPIAEDNGNYRVYPVFPYENNNHFEIYSLEIEKGSYYNSNAHWDKTEEYITVFDGELTLLVDNKDYTIKKGDSIKFSADKPHAYHNSGNELTRISMVIYYPINS